jgi:sec-independent protein translocase protein TatA
MGGTLGWPELIFGGLILLLVFGVGRITKIGGELGAGIRAFREGLSGEKKQEAGKSDVKTDDTNENKVNP